MAKREERLYLGAKYRDYIYSPSSLTHQEGLYISIYLSYGRVSLSVERVEGLYIGPLYSPSSLSVFYI